MAITRVLICEDHPIYAQALAQFVKTRWPSIQTVTIDSIAAVTPLVKEQVPQLLLLDLRLKDCENSLDALSLPLAGNTWTDVLVLSMQEPERWEQDCLAKGARGYLAKTATPEEIANTLDQWLAPDLVQPTQPAFTISPREQQVLGLIVQGLNSREISQQLNLSVRTVESHRYNMMKKIGARNSAELVALFLNLSPGARQKDVNF